MLQHKTRRWGYVFPIFFSSLFLLILLYFSASSFADQNKVSFDAEAILPENQISEASYFDLKVQAGIQQKLTIQLTNTSNRQVNVKVEANNAVTNSNGAVDYSKHGEKLLGSPTFEEIASKPQTITLKPQEIRQATFQLDIPKQGFDGTILGGFYGYEETKEKEEKNDGFSLANKFAYTIGAQLSCSDKKIDPEFALSKVKSGLQNGYLTLFATLENKQPVLMSQMQMEAEITKKGKDGVLHQLSKKISMAPRSKFELPISWENKPLKKGFYELTIHLKDALGKKWTLVKAFEIKGDDEKLNKEAVHVEKEDEPTNTMMYFFLAFCLIVIICLVWYISKLKREKS